MTTVLMTLLMVLLAIGAMSVGLLLGRRPLRGSCGGLGGRCACGARDASECREAAGEAS